MTKRQDGRPPVLRSPFAGEPRRRPPGRIGRWLRAMVWLLISLVLLPVAMADEYFVRADGGAAGRCNGLVDRSLGEAGRSRDCAWRHPFDALPPGGEPRIKGGDTLLIRAGAYRIGIGAPGSEACSRDWPWDCHPSAVPSGSAARPTRISGRSANGECLAPPQLWGAERASRVLNLDRSRHVVVDCLELTDRSSCIEGHCHDGNCRGEILRCEREHPPFGDWSGTGVFGRDSADVLLRDLDVHGFALRGFHVGRVRDWTLERVRIIGNGWSGWDGDLGEEAGSSNSGTIAFRGVEIAWNGCAERWPERVPAGCWAQTTGGYGDGLGTAETGGHWQFDDVNVHHNTSDGLDLLYLNREARFTVRRMRAENNAGNQLKVSGEGAVSDSLINGRCDWFGERYNMRADDQCRALGNAVSLSLHPGRRVELRDNRIDGVGDCLVVAEGGDASSEVLLSGNRMTGGHLWSDRSRRSCGFYAHETPTRVRFAANTLVGVRGGQCPPGSRCWEAVE